VAAVILSSLHTPSFCLNGQYSVTPFNLRFKSTQTMYQRGVLYSGVKLFNALPAAIKDTSGNPRKFKVVLKHYLLTHSYYDLEELFNHQNT
jgi:hypothetical protein